jgi:hypothetical protein
MPDSLAAFPGTIEEWHAARVAAIDEYRRLPRAAAAHALFEVLIAPKASLFAHAGEVKAVCDDVAHRDQGFNTLRERLTVAVVFWLFRKLQGNQHFDQQYAKMKQSLAPVPQEGAR